MQNRSNPPTPRVASPLWRWGWSFLTYGIAAGCLYWVFHDIRFSELLQSIEGIRWWWLIPVVVLDLLVYVCAGWEWQWLLRPVGHVSLRQAVQAVFAGRFANDVLPVHAGYIIRLFLMSQWLHTGIASIIPSLLIERLFDALWLAVGIGLTTLFFPMSPELAHTGDVLGSVILLGVVVITWVILREHRVKAPPPPGTFWAWKPVRKLTLFIEHQAQGIRSIGRSYLILMAALLSILKLLIQALAFVLLLNAYGFEFTLWVKLAIFLIAYIGMSMPSTPASVGVFQLFCAAGLRLFGVPKPAASGFALVAFVVLTVPLSLSGFWAVTRTGLTLRQIRREAGKWKSRPDH